MVTVALVVINRIHSKSKNKFAYTLISFTLIIGVSNILSAVNEAFRNEVSLHGEKQYFTNEYAFILLNSVYWLSTGLQGWIFSMRYLRSAVQCSLHQTLFSLKGVENTGTIVAVVYVICISFLTGWIIVSFPGFYDQ